MDTYSRPLPTMPAQHGHSRKSFPLHLDDVRLNRIRTLTKQYGAVIGRPVSMALIVTRALDLLHDHIDTLTTPKTIITERLALLGPARHPLNGK